MISAAANALEALREAAHPISSDQDYYSLIELAGLAQLVLIGEASHGTNEFYATRVALTRRLIAEKGFQTLAIEADWPVWCRWRRMIVDIVASNV